MDSDESDVSGQNGSVHGHGGCGGLGPSGGRGHHNGRHPRPRSSGTPIGSPGAGFGGVPRMLGAGGSAGPVVPSIGGRPLGTSRIGGRSEGTPTVRSGRDASGVTEPVSVDDTIPVSLEMSDDGAEGAGSIAKVGPEGSGSFDTMGGDASAVTTVGPSPTTVSPAPPAMAAGPPIAWFSWRDLCPVIAVAGDPSS